jgi:HSP20 family molecular chaperone IbpA
MIRWTFGYKTETKHMLRTNKEKRMTTALFEMLSAIEAAVSQSDHERLIEAAAEYSKDDRNLYARILMPGVDPATIKVVIGKDSGSGSYHHIGVAGEVQFHRGENEEVKPGTSLKEGPCGTCLHPRKGKVDLTKISAKAKNGVVLVTFPFIEPEVQKTNGDTSSTDEHDVAVSFQ